MRLVPDQEPHAIARLFEAYVRAIAPPTVEVDVALLGAARPALVARDSPAVRAPARAYRETFGAPPLFLRGGGSLPLVPDLIDTLGCPIVMIGFGLPDDNVHAPNEKLHLPNFYGGIEMGIRCLALLARE
jgi:acetylornithine deacetylase/succinyl-diaminopimelate desuccinylase-like protein